MVQFELNVGLNVYETEQTISESNVINTLQRKFQDVIFEIEKTKEVLGEWEGKPEKTLYVKGISETNLSDFIQRIENCCTSLHQDAIPIKTQYGNIMIYSRSKQFNVNHEKYRFINKYFKK